MNRMSMADPEITHDVDAVLVGLSQFKTELLQLHALVSVCVCGGGGGGGGGVERERERDREGERDREIIKGEI